jgi:enterobactin synthetase component D
VLTAVHIPDSPDPVPDTTLRLLLPKEVAIAKELKGYRQVEFVGGRIALRAACGQLGIRADSLLKTPRGAPEMPDGLVGSVSHKRTLAVAMVAKNEQGTLGIDLENYSPERLAIAKRVLTENERALVSELPVDNQWMGIVIRFSIKEAIYKALDPYVQRYVGFEEAEVTPLLQGEATAVLNLKNGEGPYRVDARYCWLRGRLLSSVRIQPDL